MSINIFLSFLRDNYRLVIDGITLIVAVILLAVRKKSVTSIISTLYSLSVSAILETEKSGLKGRDKLNMAVSIVKRELLKLFPKIDTDKYTRSIRDIIEAILETPQKH